MSTLLPAPSLGLLPAAVDQEPQPQPPQQQTSELPYSERDAHAGAVHEGDAAPGSSVIVDVRQQVHSAPAEEVEQHACGGSMKALTGSDEKLHCGD